MLLSATFLIAALALGPGVPAFRDRQVVYTTLAVGSLLTLANMLVGPHLAIWLHLSKPIDNWIGIFCVAVLFVGLSSFTRLLYDVHA